MYYKVELTLDINNQTKSLCANLPEDAIMIVWKSYRFLRNHATVYIKTKEKFNNTSLELQGEKVELVRIKSKPSFLSGHRWDTVSNRLICYGYPMI